MYKLKLIVIAIFLTHFTHAQNVIQRIYEGTINGKYPIKLEISMDANSVFGSVTYTKKSKTFQIVGHQNEDGSISLSELLPDGQVTGNYYLKESANGLTGSWLVKTGNDLVVNVKKITEKSLPKSIPKNVTGTYSYFSEGDMGASGTLQVQQSNSNKITIAFDCQGGGTAANMAVISKTQIVLKGNEAIYTNKSMGDCRIKITFNEKGVNVQYLTLTSYNCDFGNRASVVGHYAKSDSKVPQFIDY
jgi:hypothetical protein